jgi:hypothetical protein
MKKLILIFVTALSVSIAHPQSFELYYEGQPLLQNAEITISAHPDSGFMVLDTLDIRNISSVTSEVKCIRTIVENIEGMINSFCWGTCYPPNVDTSLSAVTILPQATSFEFVGDHDPNGLVGIAKVKYTFYDLHNSANQATVYVNYDATNIGGIGKQQTKYSISDAYPNPADNLVAIDYSFATTKNASIVIYNLLGTAIEKMDVSGKTGTFKVNTSDYSEGLYFYSLLIDNKVISTRKLIIRH